MSLLLLGCTAKPTLDESLAGETLGEAVSGEDFHNVSTEGGSAEPEVCDGIDNDGDGEIDEGVLLTFYADSDGDGWGSDTMTAQSCEPPEGYLTTGGDCNDDDPAINPDAIEVCNDIDDDCDVERDEGLDSTFYEDRDGDGYGNPDVPLRRCAQPDGYVSNRDDCDDNAASVSPDAIEYCDELDNDCDGMIDEGVTTILYPDSDGDGYGVRESGITACGDRTGYTNTPGDCNDSVPTINPEADEICDEADNDCDGEVDEHAVDGLIEYWADSDGDGHGAGDSWEACSIPEGFSGTNDDCDDRDPARFPSNAEVCNGIDDDCDVDVDEGVRLVFFVDGDGDGFGDDSELAEGCELEAGWSLSSEDCDDSRPDVFPGAEEVCDGIDNDCDGEVDVDAVDGDTFYADSDGDGFGDPSESTVRCSAPDGYVMDRLDCDDGRAEVNPDATESCTTDFDDNCDGSTNTRDAESCIEFFADRDGDEFGDGDDSRCYCSPYEDWTEVEDGDCNDEDDTINPLAEEVCDDIDQNCNDEIDEGVLIAFYTDSDGDGFGAGAPIYACEATDDRVENDSDCDDSRSDIFPGTVETCDGLDNNCDGYIDNDAVDGTTYYADIDGDGFGDSASPLISCSAPAGHVASYTDCDPSRADVYPGALEFCDGVDNDCDGGVDEDTVETPTWYRDLDGDGFGTADDAIESCLAPYGYIADRTDCDDTMAEVNPLAWESCATEFDDNCDGITNEQDAEYCSTFYADRDADGYGDAGDSRCYCSPFSVWTEGDAEDCNDDDAGVNPEALETCDGEDQDCDGTVDDGADWDCPSDCVQYTWEGHSYWFCESWRQWLGARDYCEDRNYDLVTVNSEDEQEWLIEVVRYWWAVDNRAYWIGLNDRNDYGGERGDSRSGWTWSSGEDYAYQAWSTRWGGQPDNAGNEDCVELNLWNWEPATQDWNDANCNNWKFHICEAGP